jgi:outer membrane protein OmpA-like peptidoglycan-associated protein
MNDQNDTLEGALERIGAALHAADRDAVVSCFGDDATLSLMSGEDRITLRGPKIANAVGTLLTGFSDLRLTPTSRHLLTAGVEEEAVMSGDHVGVFADAEPTGRRVRVNVRLTAMWGADSTLASLWVEADTRALFAQITENSDDVVGVTGGLNAIARERHDGALHIIDDNNPAPAPAPGAARTARPLRHRWIAGIAGIAVAATLMTAFVLWRGATSKVGQNAEAAAPGSVSAIAAAPSAKKASAAPKPPAPRASLPAIAKVNPKSAPKVQAGKQVVLRSDVLFAFDSGALTPPAIAAITRLARQIRSTKVTGTIQINGYTDNLGSIAYGVTLSRTRALAVARVLQQGLVGLKVTLVPQGFGHANPVAPNTGEAGRARNRRVTIVLPAPLGSR